MKRSIEAGIRYASATLSVLALSILVLGSGDALSNSALERGGSNFDFYKFDYDKPRCGRDSSVVIQDYDTATRTIDDTVRAMYANGQRRLRLLMFFGHEPVDSEDLGPARISFHAREIDNLAAMLKTIKRIGFEEVEIGLPVGESPPWRWTEWDEDSYQRSWAVTQHVHDVVAASGLKYLIDLGNEGMPARTQPMLLRFAKRKWDDYRRAYGVRDTVGFSIIADIQQDRFAQIPEIYGDHLPAAFDLHIYDAPRTTAKEQFLNAHDRLKQLGIAGIPWIIGETLYDDESTARQLREAIMETQQPVLFVLQWQLSRDAPRKCEGTDVIPIHFDNYMKFGF